MSKLGEALGAVADRLVQIAADDSTLREELASLAEAMLAALQEHEPAEDVAEETTAAVPVSAGNDGEAVESESVAAEAPPSPPRPRLSELPELTLGRVTPPPESPAPTYREEWDPRPEVDLNLVERRCRMKAEGARWAATRRRLMADAVDYETRIAPRDQEVILAAKAVPDCFLWMNHSSAPTPADLRLYDDLGDCFEALADAITLVRKVVDESDSYQEEFEQSLDLLAEAQSAVRAAIDLLDGPTDTDQFAVFQWLKGATSRHQVYIRRHMRADDPASPEGSADLSARIEQVESRLEEHRNSTKRRRKLMGKVRHKVGLLEEQPEGAEAHWSILIDTVDELIDDGVPPSNVELRELLLPHIEEVPDLTEIPQNFQLVLREIDRYLSSYPTATVTTADRTAPEVEQAARLLADRSVVLIGGERRPDAAQAIEQAFGLKELIWIGTREHQSITPFEPFVARPDVAVVLLAIRWTSHSYGEVKDYCDQHGKLLVRLPGGYNPNQVAAQIMAQCSDRLAAE